MEILCTLVGILIGIFLVHKPNKDTQAREALDRIFKRLTASEQRQDKHDKELKDIRHSLDKYWPDLEQWPETNSYREAKQH